MNTMNKDDSPPSQNTRSHSNLTRPALRSNLTSPLSSPRSRHSTEESNDGNFSDTIESNRSAEMSFVSTSSSPFSANPTPRSHDSRKRITTGSLTPKGKQNASSKSSSMSPAGGQVTKEGNRTSPLKGSKSGKSKNENKNGYSYCLFLVIVCLSVVVYFFMFSEASYDDGFEEENKPIYTDHFKKFKPEFDSLKSYFPAQSPRFWQVLGTQIKRVLTEAPPTYPAVVLIGVPLGHSQTASCLSKKLISSLNKVFSVGNDFYINSTILNQASPAKTKLDLDQKLIEILSKSRGVVLDMMEKLPAEGALLLHGYCDGDNAPHKDAVIVQVLNTGMAREGLTEWAVERKLNDLWEEDLGPDEMPALRSRIANNVIILNPEQEHACEKK